MTGPFITKEQRANLADGIAARQRELGQAFGSEAAADDVALLHETEASANGGEGASPVRIVAANPPRPLKGKDSADKGKDSGDKGKDSGDKGKDSGDKGKDSSDKGKDSGDKGKDSGDKGKDSSDKGKDSGDKGKDSGDKGKDSGDKGKDSGDKAKDSGDKGKDSGDKAKDGPDNMLPAALGHIGSAMASNWMPSAGKGDIGEAPSSATHGRLKLGPIV